MSERKPAIGSEAWFKEVENRLEALAHKLEDAAVLMAESESARSRVGYHLSIVQELVARIEDRVAKLTDEARGRPYTDEVHLDLDEPGVTYLDVPGFPGYRVGSDGSVWGSRSAGRGYGRTRDWRRLKPYLVRPGPAPTVSLYRDRIRHSTRVDALVLLTFEGPCPEGHEVFHENGDALDNRRENLCYVQSEAAPQRAAGG